MTSAATQLLRHETRLFLREPLALFWVMAFPVLLLVVLGLIPPFREPNPDLGGQRVIDLYVPISVLLTMIVACATAMPETLIGYRQRHILRRLRTTPIEPSLLLRAHLGVYATAVVVASAVCLLIGRLAYDVPLPQAPLAYVVAFALAGAACLATGALITALCPTNQVGNVVGMIVMFGYMFTSGVWVPVQTMPDALHDVVRLTPMGAGTEALNLATMGDFPQLTQLAVMAVWAVVLGVISVRTFRWE